MESLRLVQGSSFLTLDCLWHLKKKKGYYRERWEKSICCKRIVNFHSWATLAHLRLALSDTGSHPPETDFDECILIHPAHGGAVSPSQGCSLSPQVNRWLAPQTRRSLNTFQVMMLRRQDWQLPCHWLWSCWCWIHMAWFDGLISTYCFIRYLMISKGCFCPQGFAGDKFCPLSESQERYLNSCHLPKSWCQTKYTS